jgi:hypothetical protein
MKTKSPNQSNIRDVVHYVYKLNCHAEKRPCLSAVREALSIAREGTNPTNPDSDISSMYLTKNLRNLLICEICDSENYTQYCMLYTLALADSLAAQFNHPNTFLTNPYKPMKIKTLQNLNCTIYAALMHNLYTFPVQFMQIFTLFFQKFQTKLFKINILYTEKLFFTCTNRATINSISSDNQPYSTCTISSITCTNCAPYKANTTHYQPTNICINYPLPLNPHIIRLKPHIAWRFFNQQSIYT